MFNEKKSAELKENKHFDTNAAGTSVNTKQLMLASLQLCCFIHFVLKLKLLDT